MNYELFTLEQFIESICAANGFAPAPLEISAEIQRISSAMKLGIITCPWDKCTLYIREHQYGLQAILAKVETSLEGCVDPSNQKQLTETIPMLQDLLENLEMRYQKYFDTDTELPVTLYRQKAETMKKRWDDINGQLDEFPVLQSCMEAFLNIKYGTPLISYRKVYYLEEFITLLLAYLKKSAHPDLFELILFLCSVNFNHPDLYEFCYQFIKREKDSLLTTFAQAELLAFIKKQLEQNILLTSKCYEPSLPALRNCLLEYVESESAYLSNTGNSSDSFANIDGNFKVGFTVRQLAIFTRLLAACGILISDKPGNIHQYISSHCSTPDAEHISQKSFKNAYYSNASADLDKVLEKVTEVLVIGQRSY